MELPPIFIEIKSRLAQTKKEIQGLGKDINQFDKGVNRNTQSVKNLEKNSTKSFSKVSKSVKDLDKQGKEANKTFSKMGAILGVIASVAGAKSLAEKIFGSSGQLEQSRLAFNILLQDSEKAKKLLAELNDFALKTPFEITQVRETTKQLLAYGIEAREVIPTMRMLGDLSLGNAEKFGRLQYAYGQVRAANKLYGTELRQFTEAGIPIIDALAKHFNITTGEVRTFVEDGKVGFKDVKAAMQNMTGEGGMFFGMMKEGAKTLPGIISNIADAWTRFKESFVDSILYARAKELSVKFLDIATNALPKLRTELDKILLFFEQNKVAVYALGGAIGGVLVGAFIALIGIIGSALAVLTPFLIIGTALGALAHKIRTDWQEEFGALVELLQKGFERIRDIWTLGADGMLTMTRILGKGIIQLFGAFLIDVLSNLIIFTKNTRQLFENLIPALIYLNWGDVIKGIINGMNAQAQKLGSFMGNLGKGAFEALKAAFTGGDLNAVFKEFFSPTFLEMGKENTFAENLTKGMEDFNFDKAGKVIDSIEKQLVEQMNKGRFSRFEKSAKDKLLEALDNSVALSGTPSRGIKSLYDQVENAQSIQDLEDLLKITDDILVNQGKTVEEREAAKKLIEEQIELAQKLAKEEEKVKDQTAETKTKKEEISEELKQNSEKVKDLFKEYEKGIEVAEKKIEQLNTKFLEHLKDVEKQIRDVIHNIAETEKDYLTDLAKTRKEEADKVAEIEKQLAAGRGNQSNPIVAQYQQIENQKKKLAELRKETERLYILEEQGETTLAAKRESEAQLLEQQIAGKEFQFQNEMARLKREGLITAEQRSQLDLFKELAQRKRQLADAETLLAKNPRGQLAIEQVDSDSGKTTATLTDEAFQEELARLTERKMILEALKNDEILDLNEIKDFKNREFLMEETAKKEARDQEKKDVKAHRKFLEKTFIDAINKIEEHELKSISKRKGAYEELIVNIRKAMAELTAFNAYADAIDSQNKARAKSEPPQRPLATPRGMASRYHDGGVIQANKTAYANLGISGDEVPIIAQKNEFMVRRDIAQRNRGLLEKLNSGVPVDKLIHSHQNTKTSNSTRNIDYRIEKVENQFPQAGVDPNEIAFLLREQDVKLLRNLGIN